jgi:hypothetical protein
MKSEKFGLDDSDPHILEMFREDLEDGDQDTWLMLNRIEELLYGCFDFGINPLPKLRKVFPAYTWEFIDLTERTTRGYKACLRNIAKTSRFFWHTDEHGDGNHWVIAKKIEGEQKSVFGNSNFEDQPDIVIEVLREMETVTIFEKGKKPNGVKLKNNRL